MQQQSLPPISKNENFLNAKQAAQFLGVSVNFLNKLRCYGGGPLYYKFGRKVVYSLENLNGWVQAQATSSTSSSKNNALNIGG